MAATRSIATALVLTAALVLGTGTVSNASTAGGPGSSLPPVGAKQPPAGAQLPVCDPGSLDPPGHAEGACTLDRWTAVAADRNHSVALKGLSLGVVDVQQITTVKEGGGSLHPLPSDAWIQVTAQVKNTSGRPARLTDEQFNLLIGTTRFHDAPEATSSEHDGLTRGTKKLGAGKVRTGTIVFAVPVADAATAVAPSSALLFAGFGGDWGFSSFPGNTFGLVRLGR